MNELNSCFITTDDLNNFSNLMQHINALNDNDYSTAYTVQKEALRQYDRWSTILFQIRNNENKGIPKNPALKDRVAQILKMIDNAYVTARMVWGKAKSDISEGRY